MKAIVSAVLSQEEAIDNIYVNEDAVPTTCIKEHLAQFGLKCKDPERLENSARVLGLAVGMEHGELQRSVLPEVSSVITQ